MKKFYVFIIFLISALLFSGCGSSYNSSGPDSVQISLPYEDGCISDMKIDENGNLRVAMYEIDQDGKKAKATCWITRDDGKSWENLYEEYFEANDKKEETVEIAPRIAGDGLFILKYNYKGDSFEVNSEELYYIKDLNEKDIKYFPETTVISAGGIQSGGSDKKLYVCDRTESEEDKIFKFDPEEGRISETGILDKGEYAFYMEAYGDKVYCICSIEYEGTKEEQAGTKKVETWKYIKGRIYDMETGETGETDVFNNLAAMYFDKCNGNGEEYKYSPCLCPDLSSDEEAYYLADGDGIIRVTEKGEETIYKDDNLSSYEDSIENMVVDSKGNIYVYIWLDGYSEQQLLKIPAKN